MLVLVLLKLFFSFFTVAVMPTRKFWVYRCHALVNGETREYVGYSWDVLGRLKAHSEGGNEAAPYLWPKGPREGNQHVVLDEERGPFYTRNKALAAELLLFLERRSAGARVRGAAFSMVRLTLEKKAELARVMLAIEVLNRKTRPKVLGGL